MTTLRATVMASLVVLLAVAGPGSGQQKKDEKKPEKKAPPAFTSAAEAGPDFLIQGEYEGSAGDKGKYGAQVVAKGDGKFEVYFLAGGLPGAGWDTKTRTKAAATTADGKVILSGGDWSGNISASGLAGKMSTGETFSLKKVTRQSPTVGAKPPEGALVLFDGKSADEWENGKLVENDLLFCGTRSKKKVSTGKLHIEFRTPYMPKSGGQGRGNSGVYILGKEIQVLDSFGLTGEKNECGAFYGAQKPAVNMCLPPLTWQTYDVEIKKGDKPEELLATVLHNGVVVHENFVIKGSADKPATINLQNHGNPVAYRNIWFVPASQ
jgi:hypothetical protein